jgi:hypothetical protein
MGVGIKVPSETKTRTEMRAEARVNTARRARALITVIVTKVFTIVIVNTEVSTAQEITMPVGTPEVKAADIPVDMVEGVIPEAMVMKRREEEAVSWVNSQRWRLGKSRRR